jgi:phosphoglycolate phosphatase-like HAD superfamily hydrolase
MKIFLDLDGTILDVKHKCYRLYVNLLSHGGFNTVDIATYWKMKRNKVSEKEIASKTTTPMFARYYIERFMSLIETMDYLTLDSVFDSVYETLDKWFSDHNLYLVTLRQNGFNLNCQLSFFDLHKYFKHIYNVGEIGVKKEYLIKHEVSDQTNCVIIGDTEADIEAGKILGIKTVAVTSGVREKYLLEKICPDILVENVCDSKLLNWIESESKKN